GSEGSLLWIFLWRRDELQSFANITERGLRGEFVVGVDPDRKKRLGFVVFRDEQTKAAARASIHVSTRAAILPDATFETRDGDRVARSPDRSPHVDTSSW
ncbi:MAG: hypothetical protein NTV52_01370, partial [Acidobacteria bacterium]|nr:hypothetical protein [Acidobacteriota bacterium]